MTENFDLFGDPIPEGYGKAGRPEHVPTNQNRNKVMMLLALGWSNDRIASAMHITPPTLRKHYFRELKFRDEARDRMDATVSMQLWTGVMEGSVSAIKEFRKLVEKNDLMLYGQTAPVKQSKARANPTAAAKPKLGKKEQALLDAAAPDTDSLLGQLMAQRQQQMN